MLVYLIGQLNEAIVRGVFPLEQDMAMRQAAWMAQIAWGDRSDIAVFLDFAPC